MINAGTWTGWTLWSDLRSEAGAKPWGRPLLGAPNSGLRGPKKCYFRAEVVVSVQEQHSWLPNLNFAIHYGR